MPNDVARSPSSRSAQRPSGARLGVLWAALGTTLAACAGQVSDPGAQGSGSSGGTGSAASAGNSGGGSVSGTAGGGGTGPITSGLTCKADQPDPGAAPLRRLTQEQYLNTVKDLFGNVNLSSVYTTSNNASQFGLAQADVDGNDLDGYQRAAELAAAAVVADKTILARIAPCATGADARGCAKTFLQNFGTRVYRMPIVAADLDRHLALYDAGALNGGYNHGLELLLRGMMQAPRFLYRVELGTDQAVGAKAVKLSGYELAARLSYGLWNTTPDDALMAAAAGGTLATPADVATQLDRMIKDPRGSIMVRHFLESWIHLPDLNAVAKDAKRFPDWNDTLRAAMITQAQQTLDDVLKTRGGTVSALLTTPTVFVNKDLALFYGASPGALPTDGSFQAMPGAAGAGTSGLLTLPAFLATQAKVGEGSPIYRGKFVREQLLCQELPSPPAIIPPAPEVTPGVSTRERLSQHETDASCASCHRLMDPIGLGFESYDGIGKYRTTDGGKAINATGNLTGTTDVNGPFDGVAELAGKLARSADVQACVARQWFRYAMGRAEQDADDCSMQALSSTFKTAGGDLRTLPLALVQTPAFLYRRPLAQGSTP
jgi:hypothetical protein